MRTLVIGIPLPNSTFDNHSFFSAPALSDYQRMIVETETASKVIAEVVSGAGEHRTFSGLTVRNGDSTTQALGLSDMLNMRRREAEWFFRRGGIAVCFAHPDVAVRGVRGLRDWRRYSWLPAPDGFSYDRDLYLGFGKVAGEFEEDHPFSAYIDRFGRKAGYRVCFNESAARFRENARVFARSEGGSAIAAEMRVLEGAIIFLPPLIRLESDRTSLAATLIECLDSLTGAQEPSQVS